MFNSSKYTKIYYSIIDRSLSRPLLGYQERHHIIPRSLGGDNSKGNIANLTAREHYICHLLLCKMTSSDAKKKMTYAAWTMARTRDIKVNSKIYASLKEQATANLKSLQTGVPRGPMSDEHKQKIKEAAIRRYQKPIERELSSKRSTGRTHSEETKAKMRKAKEGYVPAPTYGMKGKTHSSETKEKMKAAWEKRRAS